MTNSNSSARLDQETLFQKSYERLMPEFAAVEPGDEIPVNLEIASAVITVLGRVDDLRSYRDELARLPDFDLERFDKIEDYTKALSFANTQHSTATQPPDDLKDIYEQAYEMRETLEADVRTLMGRGFISRGKLKDFKGFTGYKNVATDLQIVAWVLQNHWQSIEGKCATQPAELERAFKLASLIMRVVGKRERKSAKVANAADMRGRAFTQFSHAYDDARRAIIFLRWHQGDADRIAPSLYAGRSNGRGKAAREPAAEEAPKTSIPSEPAPGPDAAASGATAATAANSAAVAEGGPPFMQ